MKMPKKLKIGGHEITVVYKPDVEGNNDGYWDPMENTIVIKSSLPPSQRQVTLIHEMLHCMNITQNHECVEWIAQALYQVLKDNKLYFDGKDEK